MNPDMSTTSTSDAPFASPVDPHALGDFTTDRRVLLLSLIAVGIGTLASLIAVALLDLIALCTNLFFSPHFFSIAVRDGWVIPSAS